MMIRKREKVVLLGMMGRMRVAGAVWQVLHYLVGFERLGYDVYYVEAHGCSSWAFRDNEAEAAEFIASVMRRFDMGDRWVFHARLGSGTYYGMPESSVNRLYSSAAAIFNLHGGTVPTPEQAATGRLVYIDTDPVNVQLEIGRELPFTLRFLEQHSAFFTFAENYGGPGCLLPFSSRFPFHNTRQPVVMDFWCGPTDSGDIFTTIGNWQQLRRVVEYEGEEYHWSKHLEFVKFLDLPSRTTQSFELALSSCDNSARSLLLEHGWQVRDAFHFTQDLDTYRDYIYRSKGEFTVAKDQNIRFRTGWFSDRSATYLAAGKPVITQDTAFPNILPTGEGLFAFSTMDDILSAVDSINRDYDRHVRMAREIAREYFSHEVVLGNLLAQLGLPRMPGHAPTGTSINVVGDFRSGTGIGEVGRRYSRALASAGVHPIPVDAHRRASLSGGDINLVCGHVTSHFAMLSQLGEDFFRDRYNIAVWLWETAQFPQRWRDRFAYYDEVWAPSSFIAGMLAPISPVPVVRIPMVLEPEIRGSRERGQRRFGLEPDEFTCALIFDFHSQAERKNPLAVIDSFRAAFRADEPARLMIKCAHPDFNRDYVARMQERAEGSRISIHDGDWGAQEIADLIAACDCYVSLHRAEGVGLPIADAMAAGKPVIATGWSGNMDFMNVANSFPVRYNLVELDRDLAHYQAGDVWAEPSIEHASELLRYVFEHRQEAQSRGERGRREIESYYSNSSVAGLISIRIDLITRRSKFQELKRKIALPIDDPRAFSHEFSGVAEFVPSGYLEYRGLKKELARAVRENVPRTATLVVVSKGDEDLLSIHEGPAWHFPQSAGRAYAGHYPADSAEAIRHLDALCAQGGDYILFPQTAFWWLDHYVEFHKHLHHRYLLTHSDEQCRIFALSRGKESPLEAA